MIHTPSESEMQARVDGFLACQRFAVVGASSDRAKYGNKCLRTYLQNDKQVVAVHPRETEVEGMPAYGSLADIPFRPEAVSVITPPAVSLKVIEEAAGLGIRDIWLQPGAEDEAALTRAEELGLEVIAGGPCLLVALGFREE